MPNLLLANNPLHPSELPVSLIKDVAPPIQFQDGGKLSVNVAMPRQDQSVLGYTFATNVTTSATNISWSFAGNCTNAITTVTYPTEMGYYGGWPTGGELYQPQLNLNVYANQFNNIHYQYGQHYNVPETIEQKAAREVLEVKRKVAGKRAEELMLMMIEETQKKQYLEFGFFDVEIREKTYRIKTGTSGNVKLLDEKRVKEIASYCIHPQEYIPDHDTMLAQLLMLKTDEERFLKTANKTVLY